MRSKKFYGGSVTFCRLPSLAEAMRHFKETGEFILSARDDDSYDSDSRDFDPVPVESGDIDLVSFAANRRENQDVRGFARDSKSPLPSPDPSSADPSASAPSAPSSSE